MAVRKKTPGRRLPFTACGHRGFGVACQRCIQANRLEVRADAGTYSDEDIHRFRQSMVRIGDRMQWIRQDDPLHKTLQTRLDRLAEKIDMESFSERAIQAMRAEVVRLRGPMTGKRAGKLRKTTPIVVQEPIAEAS